MSEPRRLEEVLADWRGQAAVLRHNGHKAQADSIEAVCEDVARAAEDYLRWLSEENACLRSGKSAAWLRKRYPEWERQGHARMKGRIREYRMLIVPKDVNLTSAREAGREAARNLRRPAA